MKKFSKIYLSISLNLKINFSFKKELQIKDFQKSTNFN